MKLEERCQKIELILADVDGVLTDGYVVFDNQGIETKHFHIRDGMGIKLWQRAGYRFGLVTGRSSHIVKIRAAELGIDIVRQTAEDKLPATHGDFASDSACSWPQVCYIGDDLPDLPVIRAGRPGRGRGRRVPRVRGRRPSTSRRAGAGAVRCAKRSRWCSRRSTAGTSCCSALLAACRLRLPRTPVTAWIGAQSACTDRSHRRQLWGRLFGLSGLCADGSAADRAVGQRGAANPLTAPRTIRPPASWPTRPHCSSAHIFPRVPGSGRIPRSWATTG